MSSVDLELLRMLEPNDALRATLIRAGAEIPRVGPFEAYFHPDPRAPGFGYAQPIEPLPGDDDVISGLRDLGAVFVERGYRLSIEFNSPLFPRLAALLGREGLTLTDREPLMVLDPADFVPSKSPDVDAHFLQPDDPDRTLSAFARIFTEVLLDRPYEETPEGIARLRKEVEGAGGHAHMLATLGGVPAGTGFIGSWSGVAEITRVATVAASRRRGVAATLTSLMLEEHFREGATVAWLTASGGPAPRLYEKLGFRLVGERLYFTADAGRATQS